MDKMKTFYTVYSLTDCKFCKRAIQLLDINQMPFLVVVMDKNVEFLQKIKQDMNHPTVPIVVQQLDNSTIKIIGGSDDLERHLQELESENKQLAAKAISAYESNNGTN